MDLFYLCFLPTKIKMIKLSIVPELINSEDIEILDARGIPVKICEPSETPFDYESFVAPYLLIDNIEKEKYKSVEIRNINFDEIKKRGYRIVAVYARHDTRNYPGQHKIYLLEPLDQAVPNSEILAKIPNEHSVEFDVTNNRIRIKGRNSYPYLRNEDASRWIELNTKSDTR